ncbi:MAG: hypothetical protein GXO86_10745 [Chlorobi bacterium]|nr:hypothetical protein [Chlorobiota bacterium]
MKALIIGMGLLLAFSFNSCEQEKVPEKIKAAFNQKFPGAKEVDWDMEKNNVWEAEFEMNEKEMSATFDQNGKWLETETEIEEDELPAAVKETLNSQFKDYEVDEAEYVESPETSGYEIELEGNKKEFEVLIGKDGKVLKREKEEEDDDD